MSDTNTRKLITTACVLFALWFCVHINIIDVVNEWTNGAFYTTKGQAKKNAALSDSHYKLMEAKRQASEEIGLTDISLLDWAKANKAKADRDVAEQIFKLEGLEKRLAKLKQTHEILEGMMQPALNIRKAAGDAGTLSRTTGTLEDVAIVAKNLEYYKKKAEKEAKDR